MSTLRTVWPHLHGHFPIHPLDNNFGFLLFSFCTIVHHLPSYRIDFIINTDKMVAMILKNSVVFVESESRGPGG